MKSANSNLKILSLTAGFFFLFFFACGPKIFFEVAQPAFADDMDKIEGDLMGKYKAVSDTTVIVIIDQRSIVKFTFDKETVELSKFYNEFKETILKMDSLAKLEVTNDSVFTQFSVDITNYTCTGKIEGDSIDISSISTDTIFVMSENSKLREYKKIYFLNTQQLSGLWSLTLMDLNKKGILSFRHLSDKDAEIENLKLLTEVVKDTTNSEYILNPSKNELNKMLKKGSFSSVYKYQKIE